MGGIVYWGLLRTAAMIILLWLSYDYFQEKFFWIFASIAVYLIIIQPIVSQYNEFTRKNKNVIKNSLCSKCKHFNETAVLCMKYDEHPNEDYTPCDGIDWEVK
jgi:glucan phosphoethanolaminetransferase (alkaline phosphatase superfamily)